MWHGSLECVITAFDAAGCDCYDGFAGWSSLVARWAHNPKVGGSNPPPATNLKLPRKFLKTLGFIGVLSSAIGKSVSLVDHLWTFVIPGFEHS
jgi:hypothetical protein